MCFLIIRFARNRVQIDLGMAITYVGPQGLHIQGSGALVDGGGGDFSVFVSTGGGNLAIRDLTFQHSSLYGIFVEMPSAATDDLWVELYDVSALNTGLHGAYVKDCNESAWGDPLLCDADDTGSEAGIFLTGRTCRVEGGGTGELDFDGVRVDERGEGDIVASFSHCQIDSNDVDGLELDEAREGDVSLKLVRSTFNENVFYNEADLDDGVDIDKADEGGIDVKAIRPEIADNLDEGLDLDEAGEGGVMARVIALVANGNTDENIKIDEEDAGSLKPRMNRSSVRGSTGAEGMQLEEVGPVDLDAKVNRSEFTNNDDVGIKAVQGDGGEGLLVLDKGLPGRLCRSPGRGRGCRTDRTALIIGIAVRFTLGKMKPGHCSDRAFVS
jgi:hypothetical protein